MWRVEKVERLPMEVIVKASRMSNCRLAKMSREEYSREDSICTQYFVVCIHI